MTVKHQHDPYHRYIVIQFTFSRPDIVEQSKIYFLRKRGSVWLKVLQEVTCVSVQAVVPDTLSDPRYDAKSATRISD